MIQGKCPECGQLYYGFALLQPNNQSCDACGSELLITQNGKRTLEGYSPFTAEVYRVHLPVQTSYERIKIEDQATT
jgi:hypothetical protein